MSFAVVELRKKQWETRPRVTKRRTCDANNVEACSRGDIGAEGVRVWRGDVPLPSEDGFFCVKQCILVHF